VKISDTVRRAGRNLSRAKARTFLTSVAIAVGGFAIMVSLMAGEGARQYVDQVISANMDPKAVAVARDENMFSMNMGAVSSSLREYDPNSVNMYGADFEALTQADIDKLNARDDLEDVIPYYSLQPKYIEFGVKPDKKYIAQVQAYDDTIVSEVAAGSLPKLRTQIGKNEITVPESYLETLGVSKEKAIGSKVMVTVSQMPQVTSQEEIQQLFMSEGEEAVRKKLSGEDKIEEFRVVAVTKKGANEMMSQSALMVNVDAARDMAEYSTRGTDQYQRYVAAGGMVVGDKSPEDVKESLKRAGYKAATAKDLQSLMFTFVNLLQGIVMGFGVLALIVSVFGIVNTMYISVLERTQQIGLMKALGASGRDIGRLFRYEAAWVGFLGAGLGVLLAWGGAMVFNPIISDKLGLGENHLLIFQPLPAAGVIISLMLVAIVAGWLPSRKAAKLDPIDALRTD